MRVVELFCGAGGMSLGLKQAGFNVIAAYDAWPVAVANYNRNVGQHAKVSDLGKLLDVIPELLMLAPTVIVGGPPCQDYSSAGRREEADNAKLTLAFAVIVATVRPSWFLMENVINVAKSETWRTARQILKSAGYGLTESKIDASRYGVPQARRRLIVIGRIGERDSFLASAIAAAALPAPMTLRDFFQESTPREGCTRSDYTSSGAMSAGEGLLKRASNISYLSVCNPTAPEDEDLLENGYVYSRPVRAGRGVRSVDEPFPTVTRTAWERPTRKYLSAPHAADPVPAVSTAVLSIRQISRIQGFPEWWRWDATSKRDILQMIANAVPAPVAMSLGRVIMDRECGISAPAIQGGFVEWLVQRGRSRQSARNVKYLAGRARKLLCGRTFTSVAAEISELEAVEEFRKLRRNPQSDLRQALRLLAEYQDSGGRKRRGKPLMPVVGVSADDAA